jgi:hypothetical protein
MPGSRRVLVWLAPEQLGLVRSVCLAAELELVGVGSPSRGHAGALAGELGVAAEDDLRAALVSAACDLVWIAAPGGFGAASGRDDPGAVLAAHGRGVRVATQEPIPGAALDLRPEGWLGEEGGVRPLDVVRFCPLVRHGAAFREATELLETFGAVGSAWVECLSGGVEGSLGAGLYGAFELVHGIMGEPETVEAAYVSPGPGRAVHALAGETLRELHGDAVCTLRFADGRAAGVVASDRAGAWSRTLSLIGPGGRLRVWDGGFEWVNASGERVDQSRARAGPDLMSAGVGAIAAGLSRLLDAGLSPPPPSDHATVLTMTQAALLSCRTGQAESPSTIRRMADIG